MEEKAKTTKICWYLSINLSIYTHVLSMFYQYTKAMLPISSYVFEHIELILALSLSLWGLSGLPVVALNQYGLHQAGFAWLSSTWPQQMPVGNICIRYVYNSIHMFKLSSCYVFTNLSTSFFNWCKIHRSNCLVFWSTTAALDCKMI